MSNEVETVISDMIQARCTPADAVAAIEKIRTRDRIESYKTAIADIETIVALEGHKITATRAMRLISDRIASLEQTNSPSLRQDKRSDDKSGASDE